MRIPWNLFPLAFLLIFGLDCHAQLRSVIVGPPQYCQNEIGQIEISYQVHNAYTNTTRNSVIVQLGLSRELSFLLFSGREHTDPASAVYQSNQDSVKPPAFKNKKLKPRETIKWSNSAIVTIDGQESSIRLPKPGDYYLLPFPDIRVEGHSVVLGKRQYKSHLLPITIAKPNFDPPLCARHK